jgi:hypothetical protein
MTARLYAWPLLRLTQHRSHLAAAGQSAPSARCATVRSVRRVASDRARAGCSRIPLAARNRETVILVLSALRSSLLPCCEEGRSFLTAPPIPLHYRLFKGGHHYGIPGGGVRGGVDVRLIEVLVARCRQQALQLCAGAAVVLDVHQDFRFPLCAAPPSSAGPGGTESGLRCRRLRAPGRNDPCAKVPARRGQIGDVQVWSSASSAPPTGCFTVQPAFASTLRISSASRKPSAGSATSPDMAALAPGEPGRHVRTQQPGRRRISKATRKAKSAATTMPGQHRPSMNQPPSKLCGLFENPLGVGRGVCGLLRVLGSRAWRASGRGLSGLAGRGWCGGVRPGRRAGRRRGWPGGRGLRR